MEQFRHSESANATVIEAGALITPNLSTKVSLSLGTALVRVKGKETQAASKPAQGAIQDPITAVDRLTTAVLANLITAVIADPITDVLADPITAVAKPLLPRKEADTVLGPGMVAAMVGARAVSNSEDLPRLKKEVDMEAQEATTMVNESKTSAKTLAEKTVPKVLDAMIEAMEIAAMTATLMLSAETVEILAVV